MNEYKLALKIAKKAHKRQKDKVGVAYIKHPLAVSALCKSERGKIAALLHDVVEDTTVTLDDLRRAGISEDVVVAVDCVTKRKDEEPDDYYKRIAGNAIALEVKLADMQHNSDVSRWPHVKQKEAYANYAKYITRMGKLCNLAGIENEHVYDERDTY
jgi:(p)ppGpp synthase/HD superfamily hydrolase